MPDVLPNGDLWFPPAGDGPRFGRETPAEFVARLNEEGHFCCPCPIQKTQARPCCNAGHAEAVERYRALEAAYGDGSGADG